MNTNTPTDLANLIRNPTISYAVLPSDVQYYKTMPIGTMRGSHVIKIINHPSPFKN